MTTTIRKTATAGPDGNLVVPLGKEEAGAEFDIIISPRNCQKTVGEMSRQEYEVFVNSFIGSWVGEFDEPADLPFEKREEF